MDKKVLYVTDYPAKGSGYASISNPICNGLVDVGCDVKMIGISNQGEEHWEKFAIIPVADPLEAQAALHNMCVLWVPDVVIVALDIPLQEVMFKRISEFGLKYISIIPLENGPLVQSWASFLLEVDDVFFISELGKNEAIKSGVLKAKHLNVSLDSSIWYPSREGERELVRKNLGFELDEKVILTVADNQERKNIWGAMKIIQNFKINNPSIKLRYILVTREHSPYGYKLMELAYTMGLQNELIIYERGMPADKLRLLYISADAFLLTSKAEGLGLPVMEALMCGCKCVTTDTGALTDLLDGIGWLVPPEYTFTDVWGNSKRDMIDTVKGAVILKECLDTKEFYPIKFQPQSKMVEQVAMSIEEVCNGKN